MMLIPAWQMTVGADAVAYFSALELRRALPNA